MGAYCFDRGIYQQFHFCFGTSALFEIYGGDWGKKGDRRANPPKLIDPRVEAPAKRSKPDESSVYIDSDFVCTLSIPTPVLPFPPKVAFSIRCRVATRALQSHAQLTLFGFQNSPPLNRKPSLSEAQPDYCVHPRYVFCQKCMFLKSGWHLGCALGVAFPLVHSLAGQILLCTIQPLIWELACPRRRPPPPPR